ncbi:Aste57867_2467 [Aphanomyces stellatus]|uniref:Aste57867_2467 protein n=1 Tax=Aphanomyces stellatus TaxID=120398 RepID=A0A485K7Q1_9STRA|nr:hypothetical protein As57867_002461 [Aphanomyces stellatus]VFT79667.1 Aste57867_2467 [Aphanomyces stellatus]
MTTTPKKTWGYYLCGLVLVAPVRGLALASPVIFSILAANQLGVLGSAVWSSKYALPLLLYFASETLFLVHYTRTATRLGRPVIAPPQLVAALASRQHAPSSVSAFFETMASHTPDLRAMVEEWFFDTPFDQLTRPDLCAWFSYTFYSKEWQHMHLADRDEVDALVTRLYELVGAAEPPSPSAQPIQCIRHTLDPFHATVRPWVAYAVTIGMNQLSHVLLRVAGFRRMTLARGLHYWHQPSLDSSTSTVSPLVFVHGMGVGLLLYLPLVWQLKAAHPDRPLFLLEMPCISMQWVEDVPSKDTTLAGIRRMLADHGIARAHWMGHSYGTAICSWVCQEMPAAVAHATFVDPIVFYLWKRDVAYNFLYRAPSTGLELLMWYYVSTEVHVSYVMRRDMWWYTMVCFPEHLPRDPTKKNGNIAASIYLSSDDLIVNTKAVQTHLDRSAALRGKSTFPPESTDDIETTWWNGLNHGEMMWHGHALSAVVENASQRDDAAKMCSIHEHDD